MDIRKLLPSKPQNEMETRIQYEIDYIDYCERYDVVPDYNRVKTGIANAYAAGIITGACAPGYIFDFKGMKLTDHQFKILIESLTTRGLNRKVEPEQLTFHFDLNNLTDDSLLLLGKCLNHQRFPQQITIDLSHSTGFSDAGATALLEALRRDTCNLSVEIMLPNNPRRINAALLQELNDQLQENKASYKPVKKSEVKSEKKSLFGKKSTEETKTKKKSSVEKPPKKGLFATSKNSTDAKKETTTKRYTKV